MILHDVSTQPPRESRQARLLAFRRAQRRASRARDEHNERQLLASQRAKFSKDIKRAKLSAADEQIGP
jgi:hypothetical protein